MLPIVDGLESEYDDQMTFQRLNAALEGQPLFQQYNPSTGSGRRLRGHPSYVILDTQGEVVWRFVGQTSRATLEQGIEQALE